MSELVFVGHASIGVYPKASATTAMLTMFAIPSRLGRPAFKARSL